MRPFSLLAIAFAVFIFLGVQARAELKEENGWLTTTSPHPVADTKDRLIAAIDKAGATLFAVVDHAAGARKVGLDLEPTVLVIFGNPKMGTPIMQQKRMAAHDLPVRVLIWREDGRTHLAALAPSTFTARHGVPSETKSLGMMKKALENLLDAATSP